METLFFLNVYFPILYVFVCNVSESIVQPRFPLPPSILSDSPFFIFLFLEMCVYMREIKQQNRLQNMITFVCFVFFSLTSISVYACDRNG